MGLVPFPAEFPGEAFPGATTFFGPGNVVFQFCLEQSETNSQIGQALSAVDFSEPTIARLWLCPVLTPTTHLRVT